MKRISFLLAIVLITTCLTACKLFEKNTGVTCQEYENCAVFTFDNFPVRGTASFELTRTGLGEGAIYYQINLEQGALPTVSVSFATISYSIEVGSVKSNE